MSIITVQNLREQFQTIKDHPWHWIDIALVNNHKVRLGLCKGLNGWQKHEMTDEFFLVLEGKLTIELKGQPNLVLRKGDYAVIPKNTVHNLASREHTNILMLEPIHLQTTRVNF